DDPGAEGQQQLEHEDAADHEADRKVLDETFPQLGEIDVEHHDHEQEQDRDRADIDDDQEHRQEFRPHQHEQAGGVDEGEDQIQHRMHGITRHDHHHGGCDAYGGKQIKEKRRKDHTLTSPVRRVEFDCFRNLTLPAIAIGEQLGLVI